MKLPVLLCILVAYIHVPGVTGTKEINPVFTSTSEIDRKAFSEDLPGNVTIATVVAVEGDRKITYKLGGTAAEFLEINPTTGAISIKSKLDYERFRTMSLFITATDDENDFTIHRTSITINDANDNIPFFNETFYNFDLPEDTPIGHTITFMNVTDVDIKNALISVSCDTSTANLAAACDMFGTKDRNRSNHYWYGYLILKGKLDYETQSSYSVRLIAFDSKFRNTQEVLIGVIDLNDSPPMFVRAQGSVIDEGLPVGTYIDYVSAVDTDSKNVSREIRYELIGDTEALEYFTVSKVTGEIRNKVILDYEDPRRTPGLPFTVRIKARELLKENPERLGDDPLTTATASIKIRLRDINDNCPTFDKQEYFVTIREDISQGSNVPVQMTVTDKDSGARATFDLSLFDPSGTFEVTPTTARSPSSVTISVVNAVNIDFEKDPKKYDLTVRATENGEGIEPLTCNSAAVVHIQLQDVNDEAPFFDRSSYRASVVENDPGGTVVIQVTANDLDSGIFGKGGIRYSLIGSGDQLFRIDSITGVVTVRDCPTPGVAPCIDYDKENRYDLAVRAFDSEGGVGALPGTAPLIIDIINVNDIPPIFINDRYFRSIREGEIRTTDGLFLKALDKDEDSVSYSISPNQIEAALWQLNSNTGEITAIRPIQYSDLSNLTRGTFRFEATASDGKYTTTADIEIRVIDINDKFPIFLPVNYSVSIREDQPGDSFVIKVSVTDQDSPTTGNGLVDVTIDSGSLGKFVVKPSGTDGSGTIVTDIFTAPDAIFDYDVQNVYSLILKGRDQGSPSKTGTAFVTVNILDTNNKSPYFDPPTSSVTVSENVPVGEYVTTVTAKDQDADNRLVISFKDPTRAFNPSGVEVTDRNLFQNLFSIDASGIVRVNSPLDRDIVSFMTFTLYVQDVRVSPPQEGTGALYIRILEYNDQNPYFELPFYNITVLEERPLASFVGSVLARDDDDQIESYQLLSNPGNLISLSTTSGVLRVNGRLDYETQHNVTLIAQATDSGSPSLSNTTVIFINIVNINDNTPVFDKTVYQINIPEHSMPTTPLVTVSASDNDEGDFGVVEYSANDPLFRVDRLTGAIFMKPGAVLDREVRSSYTFQVTAYDSPNNPSVRLNTTVPVYIIIEDINDHCPVFQQTAGYRGNVIETADIGDQVLELFADDADSGINRRIQFSIDPTSANPAEGYNLFSIQSIQSASSVAESGRIEVKNSLRNKPGFYTFIVVASDRNGDNSTGTMCSRSVRVNVTVQEAINDAPNWILPPSSNYSINVLESQYRGMLVYDCKAEDVNTGNAGIIDYSFYVGQNLVQATDEFRINPVTCVIRAQIVYDREQVDSYVLTLVARDRGFPSASSETVLIVNVLDVNDNDPEFPVRNGETIPYEFVIPEGLSPALVGVIGVVSATDKDTDHKNNKVFYRIVAGNDDGYFVLDRESGELRLSQLASGGVDRETKASFSMDVLAYNDVSDDTVIRNRRKRSTNPSIVTVNIQVQDANDSPPSFTRTDYYGCVSLDAPFGQSILQVEAVDRDVNRAQLMEYSKISETTNGYFSIDTSLGVIRNSKLLYNINSRVPVLRIRADDNANQPNTGGTNTADTDVKIFVTDKSNEVMLRVSQPSADVRSYREQLMRVIVNSSSFDSPVSYVCIREIRDEIKADGTRSYTSSDVFLSAVGREPSGGNFIYSGEALRGLLYAQLNDQRTSYLYQTLYVKEVTTESSSDELSLTEDPVLAIFIVAILLIFLAIILFCLACCLIRNSKKKKMKKLRAERHTQVEVVREPHSEPVPSVNPVYDNRAYQGEDEYAVVKKRPAPAPAPPIIPVTVPALDDEPQPTVTVTETIHEVPVRESEPEPVIITEPVMTEEEPELQPPPSDFFHIDPEPEPVIETVIETEVVPDDEDFGIPPPLEDEIDVEIRDEPLDTSHRSPSPEHSGSSLPPPANEYRIETDLM